MGGVRCPVRGDIVWIDFSPHAGHEQGGRRPGFVVSPADYNRPSGFALLCPIASKAKGYPYEVVLPEGLPTRGVVLADQARSFDWRARRAQRICSAPVDTVDEVLSKLATLVG